MTNIVIVIPTYNRPAYLKRLLGYYSSCEGFVDIIVADSSSDDNKKQNSSNILSFSNLNIKHLDKYPPETKPSEKIADAVGYANTEYCVLCADDDFITPEGINQSVAFLEKGREFTAVQGRHINFWLENRGEGGLKFVWKPAVPFLSITSPEPEKRLTYHITHYHPTFYAVHRTSLLRMLLEESVRYTGDDRFGELLPSALTLIYGKVRCLELLYIAREVIPTSGGRTSKRMADFVSDGTYNEKYTAFKNCLSAHLSQQSRLSIRDSGEVIDRAMSAYMKPKNLHRFVGGSKNLLDNLKLPDWMDNGIRRLYNGITGMEHTGKTYTEISPSMAYYKEIEKIRSYVLNHANK